MLDAPGRRAAEGQSERRHQSAGRVPSAVFEEDERREPAEREHDEDDCIRGDKRRIGVQGRQQEKRRREYQRLRVGDLRRAREDIWIPERALSGMQGMGEKLKLGIEMRLGVPRDRHAAAEPGERQARRADEINQCRAGPAAMDRMTAALLGSRCGHVERSRSATDKRFKRGLDVLGLALSSGG